MAFQNLIRITFYSSIYVSCVMLNSGCTTLLNASAEEDEYFNIWKLDDTDEFQLVWYYNTKEDFDKNQPNKVLANDKEFLIHPDVMPPMANGMYLLEYSKVNEGEEVLDIGTGSGIHAIFAAEKATRVVATDIYAPATENAKVNAQRHGVEHKIDFRAGDLLEPLKDGEKFDVFFININYPDRYDGKDRNNLHERFFSEVRKYMKPNARIYYQTSFVKNIPYILDMLGRNEFRIMEMRMMHMHPSHHEPILMLVQSHR